MAITKEKYNQLKADGICVVCKTKKARDEKATCIECGEKQRISSKHRRDFYKENRICYRCGQEKVYGNNACPRCLEKIAEVNKQLRENNKEYYKEYFTKRNTELKEKGICLSCGKRKTENGHTYCPVCLAKKRRDYDKRKRVKIPRSEWGSYGFCYRCGYELDTDKKLCSKCLQSAIHSFDNVNYEERNKKWRKQNQAMRKDAMK